MKIWISVFSFLYCFHVGAAAPTLASVREAITKKDSEAAVAQLRMMYPHSLKNDADIARVGKWLSVFIYDDTVTYFEKAIELAGKGDTAAEDQLKKALAKEPYNKQVRQVYIAYLIDNDKLDEATRQIEESEKHYSYFKIFQLYRRYMNPMASKDIDKKVAAREQQICQSAQFSEEEKDFCKAVFFREAAIQKVKADKRLIDSGKSLRYPEALFSLWEMTSSMEYLKQYITKCQGLSDKEKRSARVFPGVCSKVKDVEPLLKTQEPEEG